MPGRASEPMAQVAEGRLKKRLRLARHIAQQLQGVNWQLRQPRRLQRGSSRVRRGVSERSERQGAATGRRESAYGYAQPAWCKQEEHSRKPIPYAGVEPSSAQTTRATSSGVVTPASTFCTALL